MDALWKHDLPEKFGPMTVKELRQNLRRGSFVVPFIVIHILAAAAMAVEFQVGAASRSSQAGMLNLALLWNSGPFWAVVALICAAVMPLGGSLMMRQELDEGNHELLVLTKVSRWKVVLGKFMALWGLSALTFVSLLPYVVVRYLVGGIEWWYELACAGTVLGVSSIFSAGTIGSFAFRSAVAKTAMMLLFTGSTFAGAGIALAASAGMSGGPGAWYHANAVAAVICYTVLGLSLARSRLRVSLMAYEIPPGNMMVGFLIFSPLVVAMCALFTAGHAGFTGLLLMSFAAITADVSPKAPKWMPAPPPNVPTDGEGA